MSVSEFQRVDETADASRAEQRASLRWAMRLSEWTLADAPAVSAEFDFLLRFVREEGERRAVFKFERDDDRRRALLSRLLARAACAEALGLDLDDVRVARTRGKKPYLASAAKRPWAPNFNFNISHEGDYVVLAAEPDALCGVDVCAADGPSRRAEQTSLLRELESLRDCFTDGEWARVEGAPDDAGRRRVFSALWSCKEAYVKARGDGLAFPLRRVEFDEAAPGSWATPAAWLYEETLQARCAVDGTRDDRWRFESVALDATHVVTVCRGPVGEARDAEGKFAATLRDGANAAHAPTGLERCPPFRLLRVEDLVPKSRRAEFARVRGGAALDAKNSCAAALRILRLDDDPPAPPPKKPGMTPRRERRRTLKRWDPLGDDAASATDLAGLVRGDGPDDDRVVCSDVVAAGRFCSGVPSRAADPTVPCAIM